MMKKKTHIQISEQMKSAKSFIERVKSTVKQKNAG